MGRVLALLALLSVAGLAEAQPREDRILPPEQHASQKAQALALTHARALRELNAQVFHCMPWVAVHKESIGFFKPRHLGEDDRYLSIRFYVDQDPSTGFARLSPLERASAMFSRYVGPMLRRMSADRALIEDPAVAGFNVIVEWLKQTPAVGARAVNETLAAFVERDVVREFTEGHLRVTDLAGRSQVLGWDGETPLGTLHVMGWEDDFVRTFKPKSVTDAICN